MIGDEWWQYAFLGAICGFAAGFLVTRWLISRDYAAKTPNEIGHRKALFIRGERYFLVTDFEYVEGVLKRRNSLKPKAEAKP